MVLFCTYLPWIWYSRSILGLYYGRHDTKLLHGETSPRPFAREKRLLNLKRGHRSARAVRAWIHSCVCAVDARDRFDSCSGFVRSFVRAFDSIAPPSCLSVCRVPRGDGRDGGDGW